MTPEKRIYDGNRAAEVLQNEVFQQVWTDIEEELTQAWKTSPQRDEAGRERLFLCMTMLTKVRDAVQATLESGKLAKLQLNHDNPTMRQEARRYLGIDS